LTAPTAPGTYTISSSLPPTVPHAANVAGRIVDATCSNNTANDAVALSGTVQLTGVEAGTYTGTFDLVLDSADHITGSFDAPTCGQVRNPDPTCPP
jgi:hypothetical protein